MCATADSRCLDFRVFGICYFERWLKTLHFCLPKNVLVKFISKHDAPLPTLALSSNIPFLEKKWILFTQEKTYVCHFLFVCFIYYIIIIILDCILISLIDFFYHIPYVICRLMIRCVLLLRKYTYSLTIEVPNFQGRTKWRNCRLSTETQDNQLGLAVLAVLRLLDTLKRNFIFYVVKNSPNLNCYIT